MAMTVGPVTLDGITPDVLAQYDTEVRWNGWLCPSLDPLGVVTVLDALIAQSPSDPAFAYEFRGNILFIDDLYDPAYPVDHYGPDEDGLYDLGSRAWVWSASASPEGERHIRFTSVSPIITCMYAGTGNGQCGGQVTQVGDGADYCQNHGSLRLGQDHRRSE